MIFRTATAAITANPAHQLIVGEAAGQIIATAQLTILDGLSRNGTRRCLIEGVRVAAAHRSKGLGAALMTKCEARAVAAGAWVMQLTTDKTRHDVHRFYEGLGFKASHIGMKKQLFLS